MKKRQKVRKGIILSTFFLFPAIFYYLSPVLIVQSSSQGIINGSFVIFTLLFLSSLSVGRAYCGWVCPGAGCQESMVMARDKKVQGGDHIKWVIWCPWIALIIYHAVKAGGYKKIDFFYETIYGLSIGNVNALVTYFIVLIVLIVLPAFIIGKRSFCHHLCWMAPFMILGRKIRNIFQWASLRLVADREACIHCHTCSHNCPMSLPVEEMVSQSQMENAECILCGTCADGCSQSAILLRYK
ncbi:MAG: 4Fe-4S binding protein [Nitrospiraceae bacterium]|nr:MAG: 4Fe-4S binding protein [Nitrospiraceae bacterium]